MLVVAARNLLLLVTLGMTLWRLAKLPDEPPADASHDPSGVGRPARNGYNPLLDERRRSMKDDDQSNLDARHYLGVLWRRKYIILGTVIVIPALVVGLSLLQHKQYEATARILVEPPSSSVSVVLGLNVDTGAPDDRQIETLGSFVATPEIAKMAASQLSPAPAPADLLDHVKATADTAANIISVTATEPTPGLCPGGRQRVRDLLRPVATPTAAVGPQRRHQHRPAADRDGVAGRPRGLGPASATAHPAQGAHDRRRGGRRGRSSARLPLQAKTAAQRRLGVRRRLRVGHRPRLRAPSRWT